MKSFILGVFVGLIVLPCALLFAAWSGRLPVHADANPSRFETSFARYAFNRAIKRARLTNNPNAVTDETLLEGLKLYRNNCAGCHGTPAMTSDWGSSHFYPRVPQFGQQAPKRIEGEIFYIVRHGIRYSGMGGWSNLMNEESTWKVAALLSRLDRLPAAVDTEWRKRQ